MKDHSLIDIIDALLNENGFLHMSAVDERLSEINQGCCFYGPKEGAFPQYLLIQNVELHELTSSLDFLRMQSVLFQCIWEALPSLALEKNTSLLLLIANPEGVKLQQTTEDFILQVEEDPFYFKKLVLVYNPECARQLVENFRLSMQDTYHFFRDQINKQSAFDAFIVGNDPIYNLIAKLYIKLPFIKLPLRDHESPITLSEGLQSMIASNNLLILWEKVCSSTNDEIANLSVKAEGEDIDNILDAWHTGEENE